MNALLFPGQGSQEIGMGAELFDAEGEFRDLVALAAKLTGKDLKQICLRGPERELVKTQNLQPLLVAVCLGYWAKLRQIGISPAMVLGHSLGEVAALAAAGALSSEDAIRVAVRRGQLMADVAEKCPGGMLAVLCSDRDRVSSVLAAPLEEQQVFLANDNSPAQVIVSGSEAGLLQAGSLLVAAKLPSRKLTVAGPWHSPLMLQARREFASWLGAVPFQPPRVPVLMNVSGALETDPERLRQLLYRNLTEPVQWCASMRLLASREPRVLFEVGPGRVLSGLARANGIADETRIINVNNQRGLVLAAVWLASQQETAVRTQHTPGV